MNKNIFYILLSIALFSVACSKDSGEDDIGPVETEPFTEGIVEMGMYSHGIDIGHYIRNLDFSRDDVAEQLEALIEEADGDYDLISHYQAIGENNPFAGLALMMNTVICDYYIKGETVFGKATGLGFTYDHYHDLQNDEGKVYMETQVQISEIPEEDRIVYTEYRPSEYNANNPNSPFDPEMFDRQILNTKENILGYACDVTVYTPKAGLTPPADPGSPVSSAIYHKIVVYTSPLFSSTINFTYPFYVPEDAGILRVDIFFEEGDQPTMQMIPEKITAQSISEAQLTIQTAEPVHDYTDFSTGMKLLALFMSGWAVLDPN